MPTADHAEAVSMTQSASLHADFGQVVVARRTANQLAIQVHCVTTAIIEVHLVASHITT
jgi:hypothetical protein